MLQHKRRIHFQLDRLKVVLICRIMGQFKIVRSAKKLNTKIGKSK